MDIQRKSGPNSWECKLGVYYLYVHFANGVYTATVNGRHMKDSAKFTSADIRDVARQCRAWISSVAGGRH